MSQIIEMQNISKIYPNGTVANKNVNFALNKGEIHALLGENGAGKSTLMKVLYGMDSATEGKIFVDGKEVVIQTPMDALENKIGMVHQHFMLVPSMSIAENLILGSEVSKRGIINFNEVVKMANEFAQKYNFKMDTSKKVRDVSVGVRQKLEILKALYRGAEVLILDEPTAVLTPQETEELFKELNTLKNHGHSIIFISHKLAEVKEICDRMTIMRQGKQVGVYDVEKLSESEIAELMVGREIILTFHKEKVKTGASALKVRNLRVKDEFDNFALNGVSFDAREGEILGVAGVEGNGQPELIDAIIGLKKHYEGQIYINNQLSKDMSIKEIRESGLRFIPEDRMRQGIIPDEPIYNNLIIDRLNFDESFFKYKYFLDEKNIKAFAREKIKEYDVICEDENSLVGALSGGNIQKVVVARELDEDPKIIIANHPTRGIDVGAAEMVRKKLIELRTKGSVVLLVSADLNEVLEVSDRIIVLHKGKIAAFFDNPKKVTEKDLGYYMLGVKIQDDVSGVVYE